MPEALIHDVRLVYESRGEGTPLLMICGTSQLASMWEMTGLPAAIEAAGCWIVTFDNRGIRLRTAPSRHGPWPKWPRTRSA